MSSIDVRTVLVYYGMDFVIAFRRSKLLSGSIGLVLLLKWQIAEINHFRQSVKSSGFSLKQIIRYNG